MKNKILCLLTLMICMGVFLLPTTAFAASPPDTTPPTITAVIDGGALHIETADTGSGVEAVFINDKRINYRVDSAIDLDYKAYAGDGEYISVYAMDFAGNKSEVIKVKNPLFTPAETPSAPAEPKPFTPDGTGTVMDNVVEVNGKEFFTVTTPEGNVFYLIIDRDRNNENVYLLNAVTEDDLAALAQKSDKKPGESAIPTPEPQPDPKPTPEPEPQPEQKPKSNNGMMIFMLLAVAAVGGAGYYFKVYKPKQQAPVDDYDEDEDMEFEDEDMSEDETSDGESADDWDDSADKENADEEA